MPTWPGFCSSFICLQGSSNESPPDTFPASMSDGIPAPWWASGEVVEDRRPQDQRSSQAPSCMHQPPPSSSWLQQGITAAAREWVRDRTALTTVACLLDKSSQWELVGWHPSWSRKETVPIGYIFPFSYRVLGPLPSILTWSTADKGTRKIGIAQRQTATRLLRPTWSGLSGQWKKRWALSKGP